MNILTNTTFIYYLIAINLVGVLLSVTSIRLSRRGSHISLNIVLCIIALLGGSIGILLTILISDLKPQKSNMLSRLIILCIFVIELIAYLMLSYRSSNSINLNFYEFFAYHRWLIIYLSIINTITFIVFAADKFRAVRDKGRVRIVTLLGLCILGGSLGGLLSMYIFRHKTRVNYFTLGIPLIILTHLIILIYIMNTI